MIIVVASLKLLRKIEIGSKNIFFQIKISEELKLGRDFGQNLKVEQQK